MPQLPPARSLPDETTPMLAKRVNTLIDYVAAQGAGGGSGGTVTDISVVPANGVSASVATSTTTPALTFTLGNITPVAVTASGAVTGTNLSGTNTGDQLTFKTISVSGQSNVVADTTTDTLTLAAGSGVTITTNASTDTITIAASGGSGTVTASGSPTVGKFAKWTSATDITKSDSISEGSGRVTIADSGSSLLNAYQLQVVRTASGASRMAIEQHTDDADGSGIYLTTHSAGSLTSQVSLSCMGAANAGTFKLQGAYGGGAETVWVECSNANGFLHRTDVTLSDVANLIFGTSTGTKIGTATGQKIAFHNSTPVTQRAGAAQAAVTTTAATNIAPYGFSTQAQADAIITLLNEIRAALVEKGLIKGSA